MFTLVRGGVDVRRLHGEPCAPYGWRAWVRHNKNNGPGRPHGSAGAAAPGGWRPARRVNGAHHDQLHGAHTGTQHWVAGVVRGVQSCPPSPPPAPVQLGARVRVGARSASVQWGVVGPAWCQVSMGEGRRLPHGQSTRLYILSLIEFYSKINLGKQLTGTSKACICGMEQGLPRPSIFLDPEVVPEGIDGGDHVCR